MQMPVPDSTGEQASVCERIAIGFQWIQSVTAPLCRDRHGAV